MTPVFESSYKAQGTVRAIGQSKYEQPLELPQACENTTPQENLESKLKSYKG